ncbi:MAG: gliding motility-associated C-terminal domain-containing protein [Flavobacteriales bacterium]|nr:gliding motility-associated C-terminal domain-containing protein [Flavobacteriales bacterium]
MHALLRQVLVLVLLAMGLAASAQSEDTRTLYWTGASGRWDNAANWSVQPNGNGGAGVPRVSDNVVIAPTGAVEVQVRGAAWCNALVVDGSMASVQVVGDQRSELNIAGDWRMQGDVQWLKRGDVRLVVRQEGVELDLRSIPLASRLVFEGSGSWSVISDLVLRPGKAIVLREGVLIANGSVLRAGALQVEGRRNKRFLAGSSLVMLDEAPAFGSLQNVLAAGNSKLVVGGMVSAWEWEADQAEASDRDVNVCGTGPGQTPFIVDAQVVSSYNGFGVRCRGECNATVTVTVTGGVGPVFTYQWLNGGPNTQTWTSACGGPQIVIVTDLGQGISCPVAVNVSEPAPLGVIFFGPGTPPTCPTSCNGTRTALGVGGVAPITYNWNNGAGTSSSFFGLCPGLNTLVVTDANNCTFDTTFFFDLQPLDPSLLFSGTSCFGACDGTAEINPQGGTPPYTVTWSPQPPVGQGTNSVSGLCAGPWSVTLLDANGCDTTIAFVIDEPPPIDLDVSSTDASCFGVCDGSATIIASGTPGPFDFNWSPAPGGGQGTGIGTGLCAGTYQITITDLSTGCDTLVSITIDSPGAIDVQGTAVDASCADACDGSITTVVNGGTAPYTYTWSPVPAVGQGTPNVSGLCPGIWSLTVLDAAGCDTTVSFTINAPPPLAPTPSSTDVTCAGACDGTATVLPMNGGVGGYTYVWTPAPGAGQGTGTATGLCAGPIAVTITDANGCDTTVTFLINEPPPLDVVASQTDLTCGSLCDGTASVSVSGGTPGYTYNWSPAPGGGQGTANATGLCAGLYSVTITDANGCDLVVPFTILDAVPIELSLQVLPTSCPGVCDGTAGVIATGGVAPYTYLWSPAPGGGQGTANVTGLCPQAYTLTVTDAVGCDTTIAFTVLAPDPITVTSVVNDAICAGECTGSVALTVSGGTGVYTYLWSPAPGGGQGTANATGLCAGTYSVTITSGVCDTTLTFLINEPPPIEVDVTIGAAACAGTCVATASATTTGGTAPYTWTWSPAPGGGQGTPDATGLCPGTYQLLVVDALGCDTTLTIEIVAPAPITVDLVLTEAGCDLNCAGTATATVGGGIAPYAYQWGPGTINGQGTAQATNLCPGNYTLTITDAAGCDTTVQFIIVAPADINSVVTTTDVSCNGDCDGTASVSSTGGILPYTYTWTPAPGGGQGTNSATGLCAGVYDLRIVDAIGCDTVLQITILEPPALTITSSFTNESCAGPCDGTAGVTVSGGVSPYQYLWSPLPPVGQGTPNAEQLCAGLWSVTITDANGCDTTLTFDILPQQPIDVQLAITDVSCAGGCDASVSATSSGGVDPYTYTWDPAPAVGQGTATPTGFCAGNYTVLVVDAAGCDTTIAFVIAEPPPLVASVIDLPANCNDPCTGSAEVIFSGGTGNVVILWQPDPGGGQGITQATGLCAGDTYSVTLTDDNGCDTTITFTIDPFQEILSNGSTTPATCANTCDGSATVGPTGGTAPYTYVWSPAPGGGQNTPQATELCPGVVEVTITDVDGCSTLASLLVLSPDPLAITSTLSDVSCPGLCDGSITLNVGGGVAPYTYLWSPVPPNGQGTNSATGLCPGTWSVTVSDANGCDSLLVFTITEPAPVVLDAVTTPSACLQCIGTAEVIVSGGSGLFAVEWTDALGNVIGNGTSVGALCAGLYTVTVTPGNNCVVSLLVPITDADGETITTTNGETTCPDTCDGTVSATYTCSEPPCTIEWTDAQGNTIGSSDQLTGLCVDTYFATITNALGCVSIAPAEVLPPPPIGTAISSTPVSCAGACDGTATVGITSGQPPFTFVWSPVPGGGQGTPFATGLCAGFYEITIGTGAGCFETVSVLILEPTPVVIDALTSDISCAGECDGSIALTLSGGVAPYNIIWSPVPSNGQGNNEALGLCAGTYTAAVFDANGCSTSASWNIVEPAPLAISVSSTQSTCPICDGTASVNITGGTLPYTIAWTLNGVVVSTDPDAVDLCGGLYVVEVTDANGCSVQEVVQVSDADAEVLVPIDGQASCANGCDGTIGVTFTCTAEPCVVQWTDASGAVIAGNVLVVADLCPGTYTVQVTNANGCVSFADASVLPSQVIIPNLSSTPVLCAGACTGSATVGPVGGIAPYTFNWSPEPGGGQGTPQATGLCAGVYAVQITDATGCDTTVTVLILEPPPLVITGTAGAVACNGDCNGTISVVVTGGVAPYTYAWSDGQQSAQATGLCAGSYTLTVTDANGCTSDATFEVTEPDPLVLAGASTQSECGVCNGGVEVTASGGTQPYVEVWSSVAGIIGTGPAITDLCAGIYTVQVFDANGCEASLVVPVSDVDGEVLTTAGTEVTCPGDCDGSVSVDLQCSEPPCTIAWFDGDGNDLGQNTAQVDGLCAGTYYVQVTNGIGCITVDTATVTAPDPILANLSTVPVSCAGLCDGSATVGPTGGSGDYTYFWEPGAINGQGTPQATGLCAGSYTVTITDVVSGCSIVQGVLILEPGLLVTDPIITSPLCFGDCTGVIEVNASGGVIPYTYNWSPVPPDGQGVAIGTGLCAGNWQVEVSDGNGCSTLVEVDLVAPDAITIDVQTTDNNCFGDCQGTATALVSGGLAPYVLTWTDATGTVIAQGVNDVATLCAGDYEVQVVDANGCIGVQTFSIGQQSAIEANLLVTNETCFGPCDGTAAVAPVGGVGPYDILWSPEPDQGQGTEQVSGLCADSWQVTITDQLGCDSTYTFLVLPYQALDDNASVVDVLCASSCTGSISLGVTGGFGNYTYAWSPVPPNGDGTAQATGLCAGTYNVTVSDGVGCDSTFIYTVTEPPAITVSEGVVVPTSCADANDGSITVDASGGVAPLSFSWVGPGNYTSTSEDINDLFPGTYTLTVTDANGCSVQLVVLVDALSTVQADAGADQDLCFGATITLDGSQSVGAVTYTWTNDQGAVVGNSAVIDPGVLAPGSYTFTLTVADGPCTSTAQVTITVLELPVADAGEDRTIFPGQSTALGGSPSGPAGSTFTWSPDTLISSTSAANPTAAPVQSTWYVLNVVAPNGCIGVDSVLVTVVPEVVITSGFTPNGDGWNDTWIIDNIELFPDCEVEIYNRWGELLFQSVGYRQPWDGRYKGGQVPVGTYYYIVKLNDPEFPEPFTGPLTVIR